MSFEAVLGQDRAVAALRRRLEEGSVPHALLFTGPRGTGKRTAALELARCLLCPQRGCGACPNCRKAAAGTHPDVIRLEPNEKSNILIGDVQAMLGRTALKPFEAAAQVAIIDDADRMTEDAQNSFLKGLEEPAPGKHFILVTSEPRMLAATVVSRCQRVAFGPLSEEAAAAILRRGGADAARAAELARMARGSMESVPLADDEDLRAVRERAFALVAAARTPASGAAPERSKATKQEALREIDALAEAFRDLLVLRAGGGEGRLLEPGRSREWAQAARRYSADEIADALEAVAEAREGVERSLNLRLVYAQLWKKTGIAE